MTRSTYNCRTCGACCIPEFATETHVDLFPGDVQRMSAHARRYLKVHDGNGSITTKHDKHDNTVCAFLRGTPGKRTCCSIYTTRPKLCQTFPVGSVSCKESRTRLGLTI